MPKTVVSDTTTELDEYHGYHEPYEVMDTPNNPLLGAGRQGKKAAAGQSRPGSRPP